MIGIYKITNRVNGKAYVGQSVNIEKRWRSEKTDSQNPNADSYNYPLSRAFRKYGLDNFSFDILEQCDINDLNNRERYWIHYYDTFFNGYNQTFGGDSSSKNIKEKIIGIMLDLETTSMKHGEIAAKWNITTEMVQGINTGRYWRHDRTYPIQKRPEPKKHLCSCCGRPIERKANLCLSCYNIERARYSADNIDEVVQLLRQNNGNFSKVAKIYNVSDVAVRKWLKKYNLPIHSKDYRKL